MRTRFILIGYGWRADFFHRIARELPEDFEMTAAVLRTRQRAREVNRRTGAFATDELDEALKTNPDFAVLCVPRDSTKDYLERLMEKQAPVLCETPPAKDKKELRGLWESSLKYGGRVQVAEQYFLQPFYASILRVIGEGIIGKVSNMSLSALHGYHAVSIFRKALGTGFCPCKITGRRFFFPVTATNGRGGVDRSGEVLTADRDLVTFQFEDGKTAFLDFSGEQYFSLIRTGRLNIQGLRGEINNLCVRYLNEENIAVQARLNRLDDGVYNNSGWTHRGIMLGERFLYENPFYGARLNDDEIAVADCMRRMKRYVDTGEEFYPLKEAIWDAYLSFLMEEAVADGQEKASGRAFF